MSQPQSCRLVCLPAEIVNLILDELLEEPDSPSEPNNDAVEQLQILRLVHRVLWAFATPRLFTNLYCISNDGRSFPILSGIENFLNTKTGYYVRTVSLQILRESSMRDRPLPIITAPSSTNERSLGPGWAGVEEFEFEDDVDKILPTTAAHLMQILPKMSRLEDLQIHGVNEIIAGPNTKLLDLPKCALPRLKKLDLVNCNFRLQGLQDFLMAQRESLRDLSLDNCEALRTFPSRWLPKVLRHLQLGSLNLATYRYLHSTQSADITYSGTREALLDHAKTTYNEIQQSLGLGELSSFGLEGKHEFYMFWMQGAQN